MKKLIISAMCVLFGVAAYASIPAYQVYDLKFTAKTTAAKGITELSESCCGASGDEYCYREKSTVVLKGVLAGCHCGAILANGSCKNAILYLWDETRKLAITKVETTTGWRVQVIGKKQNVVEHFMRFTGTYGDNDEYSFDITLCGFGSNKKDSKNPEYSYATGINGYFAGLMTAPYYFKAGNCSACHVEEDTYEQSIALAMCGCSDYESDVTPEVTPFGGTYSVNYNASKSSKASKSGISQKIFGLPSYVGVEDYVATNVGE